MAMLAVLNVLATVFTVLRSWPQFTRIVVRKNRSGVSALTWSLALANHTIWIVYGALANEPLLIVANILAGAGCAAIVGSLRSPPTSVATTILATATALALLQLGENVLLIAGVSSAIAMFLPQAIRVIRSNSEGISTLAWTTSALSSITWLTWGFVRGRPALVTAHFVMLPVAIFIALNSWRHHRVAQTVCVQR